MCAKYETVKRRFGPENHVCPKECQCPKERQYIVREQFSHVLVLQDQVRFDKKNRTHTDAFTSETLCAPIKILRKLTKK